MSFAGAHRKGRVARISLIAACAMLATASTSLAQDDEPAAPQEAAGAPGPTEAAAGHGATLIPFPVIFYQPETGFGFGASVLMYYPFTPGDTVSPPSSVAPVAIYTTKNQIILGVFSEMYLAEDRWRIGSSAGYSKFPNKFWGIGNDTPDEAEEDYTPVTFQMLAWPQKRIADGWFAGFGATLISRRITELEVGGLLDSGLISGTEDGQMLGFRGSLVRDTRGNVVYPRRGGYHQLLVDGYPKVWVADFGFARYTLDLRGYLPIGGTHVLALQALGVATSGSPPFDQLPELGGDRLLRGYFQGRYRDRDLIAFQGEYRLPLFWRVGAAGFVGAGQVASELSGFGLDRFHVAGGLGLRFLLAQDEGLNIRADFAFGEGTSGFYLAFGEAF